MIERAPTDVPTVLYVDDDRDNLTAFRHLFADVYRVLVAQSADHGIEVLRGNDVDAVLSDQRMPGVTGVEFLERIRPEFPHAARLLVTAYSDEDALEGAINRGNVDHFIRKPWDPVSLRQTIDRSVARVRLEADRERLVAELEETSFALGEANSRLEDEVLLRTAELRASERRARILGEVATLAGTSASRDETLRGVLIRLIDYLDLASGQVFEVDEDGRVTAADIHVTSGPTQERAPACSPGTSLGVGVGPGRAAQTS